MVRVKLNYDFDINELYDSLYHLLRKSELSDFDISLMQAITCSISFSDYLNWVLDKYPKK